MMPLPLDYLLPIARSFGYTRKPKIGRPKSKNKNRKNKIAKQSRKRNRR